MHIDRAHLSPFARADISRFVSEIAPIRIYFNASSGSAAQFYAQRADVSQTVKPTRDPATDQRYVKGQLPDTEA